MLSVRFCIPCRHPDSSITQFVTGVLSGLNIELQKRLYLLVLCNPKIQSVPFRLV